MGAMTERILSRLLDQQRDGDDWNNFFDIIAAEAEEIIEALVDMSTLSWKDTAGGWWLDRVGEIVGVPRPGDEEVDDIFTVCEYTDEPVVDANRGWGDTSNPSTGGIIWDINGVILEDESSDEDFLDFIEAKIAATNADASIPGLALYCYDAFGLEVTVTVPEAGKVLIELPTTGYDLRQRRYLEIFCPAIAGVDVLFDGWPEIA